MDYGPDETKKNLRWILYYIIFKLNDFGEWSECNTNKILGNNIWS